MFETICVSKSDVQTIVLTPGAGTPQLEVSVERLGSGEPPGGAMNRSEQRLGRSARIAACFSLIAAGVATAAPPTQGTGRVIQGTVLDSRDRPVAQASVILAGGPAITSDDSGRFRLDISHQARVVFDVRRVGYMPSRVALAPGADTTVSVLLLPTVQQLSGVTVNEAARKAPSIAGFEERMLARKKAAGTGYFLSAQDITAMSVTRTTQVVENTPSMTVRRRSGDNYAIYGRATTGGECLATVWIDGIQVTGAAQPVVDRRTRRVVQGPTLPELDAYIIPTDLAGVEIYPRGIMAPAQIVPPGDPNATRCAIVAFWTKHGG
jgi:hypothetical protein